MHIDGMVAPLFVFEEKHENENEPKQFHLIHVEPDFSKFESMEEMHSYLRMYLGLEDAISQSKHKQEEEEVGMDGTIMGKLQSHPHPKQEMPPDTWKELFSKTIEYIF